MASKDLKSLNQFAKVGKYGEGGNGSRLEVTMQRLDKMLKDRLVFVRSGPYHYVAGTERVHRSFLVYCKEQKLVTLDWNSPEGVIMTRRTNQC